MGAVGCDIAVHIISVTVAAVPGISVLLGRFRAGVVVTGQRCNVASTIIYDVFFGEGVGGGPVVEVLACGQAVCAGGDKGPTGKE